MKVAVIGSRGLTVSNLGDFLPPDTDEIVSGGAVGIDTSAKNYAVSHNIKLREFLPDYSRFKRSAPLVRNRYIVDYADLVLAFWDGRSRGTAFVINYCRETGKPVRIISPVKPKVN